MNNPFLTFNKKKNPNISDNVLEAIRSISGNVGKTVDKELISKTSTDIFDSLVGNVPRQGETQVALPEQKPDTREIRNYRPETTQIPYSHEPETGLLPKLTAIRQELAALSKSIGSLDNEVQKAITEIPPNPGIYHLNFLDRLKLMLEQIRQNVEDSRTWLKLSSSRKKKIGYWGMYKKQGTTFGLSNERTLATHAG